MKIADHIWSATEESPVTGEFGVHLLKNLPVTEVNRRKYCISVVIFHSRAVGRVPVRNRL
jgi:hypothetical protein